MSGLVIFVIGACGGAMIMAFAHDAAMVLAARENARAAIPRRQAAAGGGPPPDRLAELAWSYQAGRHAAPVPPVGGRPSSLRPLPPATYMAPQWDGNGQKLAANGYDLGGAR